MTAAVAALGIAALCVSFFTSLSPAADKWPGKVIEFDLTSLVEGEHVRLNIFGKPVFIRHRSPADIEAVHRSYESLGYPVRDEDRLLAYEGHKDPRYIILEGLDGRGYVTTANMGDFEAQGGWYSIGSASHFDGSGRLQKGLGGNMRVPPNARLSSMTTVQFLERLPPQLPD